MALLGMALFSCFRTPVAMPPRRASTADRPAACMICGASFTGLSDHSRQLHVNRCIDRGSDQPNKRARSDELSAPASASAAAASPIVAAAAGGPENNVAGYAARLRQDVEYGVCGLKETFESAPSVRRKVVQLAELLRRHKGRVWCCTGAGISTSAGLPDFRGPQGIWTKQQVAAGKGRSRGGMSGSSGGRASRPVATSFGAVKPSPTHHALTSLVVNGYINHIATQNVDGLHRRAGAPLDKLSELHGNVCLETCTECQAEYHRDDDVGGVGLQLTGSKCEQCGGPLRDNVLDWDDALPKAHLRRTERRARCVLHPLQPPLLLSPLLPDAVSTTSPAVLSR